MSAIRNASIVLLNGVWWPSQLLFTFTGNSRSLHFTCVYLLFIYINDWCQPVATVMLCDIRCVLFSLHSNISHRIRHDETEAAINLVGSINICMVCCYVKHNAHFNFFFCYLTPAAFCVYRYNWSAKKQIQSGVSLFSCIGKLFLFYQCTDMWRGISNISIGMWRSYIQAQACVIGLL